ncbi:hypothetical protein ACSUZJ_12040 [Telluria sp. B2]
MTSAYYRPSGRVPVRGKFIVAAAALAALPMAGLHAWASFHAELGVSVFTVIVASSCLALLAKEAAARGKIRNPRWMGGAGMPGRRVLRHGCQLGSGCAG